MWIDFYISNCKNRFEIKVSKYKLAFDVYLCEFLVSSRCQIGFYKKKVDFFSNVLKHMLIFTF